MRRDTLIIKILALIFPILLFVFKYILPSIAEAVYNNTIREKEQVKIELIHFPVDLLFVAISYTIPKIVEVTTELSLLDILDEKNIQVYQGLINDLAMYCAETVVALLVIPFAVFFTKIAENDYFKKRRRWILHVVLWYFIAIVLIVVSLFG